MADDLIERLARAAYLAYLSIPAAWVAKEWDDGEVGKPVVNSFRRVARAVLDELKAAPPTGQPDQGREHEQEGAE